VYFELHKNNKYGDLSTVIKISKKIQTLSFLCSSENKIFVTEILYVSKIHHYLLLEFCYIIF
jgi:hypothetical protein